MWTERDSMQEYITGKLSELYEKESAACIVLQDIKNEIHVLKLIKKMVG